MGRFPFDQIFRFEILGIPCDEWNSNFPVRSINHSQAIGFQVSRENTRSDRGLFYLCLLALALLNDSEVKINDVLGEGDYTFYRNNLKGVRDYIYGTFLFS